MEAHCFIEAVIRKATTLGKDEKTGEACDGKIKAAARPRAKIQSAHWVGTARLFSAGATLRPPR
jgi:hypothetical protein